MNNKEKMYTIFDGRYRYDEDRSICLEVVGSTDKGVTLKRAIVEAREANRRYGDCVLVEDDWDTEKKVSTNGRIAWDPREKK